MGKDIYKKGLILLGAIVVAIITFLGYMMQSNNANNIEPYDESELKESEEEFKSNNEDQEKSNQEDKGIETSSIFIDISGAVKNPGIYELNDGARLNDAIDASGGLVEDANLDYVAKILNKASILNDEEKIYIPFEKDDLSLIENNATINKNTSSTSTKADNNIENAKININTATKEQLIVLKGIGDSFAQRIIDYRQENKFIKIEDIKNIKGIGEKTFENIKDKITVK